MQKRIDKNGLNTHMSKHTGIRPFPCPVCGDRFASKGNPNTHVMNVVPDLPKHLINLSNITGRNEQSINLSSITGRNEV